MSQVMIRDQIHDEHLMTSGHLACPGCGGSLAMDMVLSALGEETIVVIPACCWSIIAGPWPQSSLKVPLYHTAFETAAAVSSGVKAGLTQRGDHDTTVIAWAGDGGTFDMDHHHPCEPTRARTEEGHDGDPGGTPDSLRCHGVRGVPGGPGGEGEESQVD